jgi:hypothetical protein
VSPQEPPKELSEGRRREIFLALAEAQDLHEFTPAQARQLVGRRFGVSEAQLRRIEQEGREQLWPTE